MDTPKKVLLKKDIRACRKRLEDKTRKLQNLQKINKRLTKKNSSLKSALKLLKNKKGIEATLLHDLSQHLEITETFNALYLKNVKHKKKPFAKYPPAARKFAITLHFYSPAAYKYLRKMFNSCLPHPRTLYDWYRSVEAEPGFTHETLERLKEKSKTSTKKLLCSLIIDEMSIRQQKIWNGKKYEGVVDVGVGTDDSNEIASQAYVFLLVSVNESWKIPLAYFLITNLTAEMKVNLINIALNKCHLAGVKVVSLTFDGCKTNLATMKLLGCNIDEPKSLKTNFKHPAADYNVVVFLDGCHMVKLMRNVLEAKKIIFNKEKQPIRWKLITDLHDLQEKNELHLANKLTHKHIEFKNNIMNVKLATQLLSLSVAKAIEFCDNHLKLSEFKHSSATTEFITILNNIFDILNSRNLKHHGFKKPMNPTNCDEIIAYLKLAKDYLISLSIDVKRKRTIKKKNETRIVYTNENIPLWKSQSNTGVIGLLVCMESLQYLYENLVQTNELSFLTAYKFCQDHVELFFGNIRSQGGFNNNPNCRQFKSAYKKILMHLELGSKFSGNAIPLDNIPILNCGNTLNNINKSSAGYRHKIENELITHKNSSQNLEIQLQDACDYFSSILENSETTSSYIDQIVGYIAGFVVRHLQKKMKCDDCKKVVLANNHLWFHKLIDIKNMGGLFYAAEDVFIVCKKTEEVIRRFLRMDRIMKKCEICTTVMKTFVHINIFQDIHLHSLDQPAAFNHRITLLKAVIEKYIDVRSHYIAKKQTLANKLSSKRQLYNKLILFKGN